MGPRRYEKTAPALHSSARGHHIGYGITYLMIGELGGKGVVGFRRSGLELDSSGGRKPRLECSGDDGVRVGGLPISEFGVGGGGGGVAALVFRGLVIGFCTIDLLAGEGGLHGSGARWRGLVIGDNSLFLLFFFSLSPYPPPAPTLSPPASTPSLSPPPPAALSLFAYLGPYLAT
ncbi:hypothetical protein TIFTF001_007169 [Ficus carica]|uniref:Uncharacterized protein n=1 Tax=Ficus carica TaxID=3494 RepID=A0AA87ZSX3_FICCA|nr:hypothetical protein TIFTF001_007169 [Ficus carica]